MSKTRLRDLLIFTLVGVVSSPDFQGVYIHNSTAGAAVEFNNVSNPPSVCVSGCGDSNPCGTSSVSCTKQEATINQNGDSLHQTQTISIFAYAEQPPEATFTYHVSLARLSISATYVSPNTQGYAALINSELWVDWSPTTRKKILESFEVFEILESFDLDILAAEIEKARMKKGQR